MTHLTLAAKACSQCLTSKDRIVPGERAAQIIRDCRRSGNHFVCHKSEDGEVVHCRGVHDLHESNAYRFATRLGIPIIEKDMDQ